MSEHRRPSTTPKHDVVTESALGPADKARSLVAGARTAALGSLHEGFPFVSHVVPVAEPDGDVLFLFSGLAEHTKALLADPRASLLCVDQLLVGGDPSALSRVTLLGTCTPVADAERAACTERYVAACPHAAHVATFADFRPYRFVVREERAVRWIGGFGRAAWLDPAAYRDARVDPVAALRPEALALAQHALPALHAAATARLAALDGEVPTAAVTVQVLAVDSRGVDVLAHAPEPRALRFSFGRAAPTLDALTAELASLGRG